MRDLAIILENRSGALAEMGEALGRAGVSIEGGGAWVVDGRGVAHFLFTDGTAARQALEAAGIQVLEEREVLSKLRKVRGTFSAAGLSAPIEIKQVTRFQKCPELSNSYLVQRLKQDVPGQLGLLTRRMAEAGVNIEVLYSDHNHQLILVVDDPVRGREVSEMWAGESRP